MVRAKKERGQETQLYDLFRKLSAYEQNERELGLLISYTVASSLIGFKSESGSVEERRHQQVKAVYSGLEEAIEFCKEEDSYHAFCQVRPGVESSLREYIGAKEEKPVSQSELLTRIFNKLSRSNQRNPTDRLKRDGIALYNETMREGQKNRRLDVLTADYALISSTLG
ncbi:hypothetical protein COY27_02720 [Candidatus Woesearchaeota archaeon CG_4_10_14_0_2_um_filter_33_13]|nr:MAG: hypothetical protein COY27_02720 [Candidatus Woesearchaeota archaeon CG_4_10_14_0_2_um_filter_33_13]